MFCILHHARQTKPPVSMYHEGRDKSHIFARFTRPGRPPPNGDRSAKSMCFWLSTRTRNDGTLTSCFPTLHTPEAEKHCVHGLLSKFKWQNVSPDVPLANEDSSVVDGFSMSQLEHESLQATLQEVRRLQGQDIIQTLLGLIQETIAVHTLQKRIALENTTRIALLEREQRPCSIPNLRQLHLHTPELTLVAETILTNQFQLRIQALLLIRTARLLESFTICRTANAAQCLPTNISNILPNVVLEKIETYSCGNMRRGAW